MTAQRRRTRKKGGNGSGRIGHVRSLWPRLGMAKTGTTSYGYGRGVVWGYMRALTAAARRDCPSGRRRSREKLYTAGVGVEGIVHLGLRTCCHCRRDGQGGREGPFFAE